MGIVVRKYLECPIVVVCRQCRTHLADAEGLISRDFQGQHGRAHLYKEVCNFEAASSETKAMTTGRHEVADISCIYCGTKVKAFEQSQVYKEGHYILERALIAETKQDHSPQRHRDQ